MDKGRELQMIGAGFGVIGYMLMLVHDKPSLWMPIAFGSIFIQVILLIVSAFVQKNLKPLWLLVGGIVVGAVIVYAMMKINNGSF